MIFLDEFHYAMSKDVAKSLTEFFKQSRSKNSTTILVTQDLSDFIPSIKSRKEQERLMSKV